MEGSQVTSKDIEIEQPELTPLEKVAVAALPFWPLLFALAVAALLDLLGGSIDFIIN